MTELQQTIPSRSSVISLTLKSAAYDLMSEEYYLPERHPTCANFTALHDTVLDALQKWIIPGNYLEVGCGIGRVDRIAANCDLLFTDLSIPMLSLARARTGGRFEYRRMNALEPDILTRFDGVVAFLADPYNHPQFYSGIRRLLKTGGFLAVTLPNHVWASALRRRLGFPSDETLFILRDGSTVPVPSITRTVNGQQSLLSNMGYSVVHARTMTLGCRPTSRPSHHVTMAAEELGLQPTAVPLLDLYVAIRGGH